MAIVSNFTENDSNIKKGTGFNDLVSYVDKINSGFGNGEVNVDYSLSFEKLFSPVRASFLSSYDEYAQLLYKTSFSVNLNGIPYTIDLNDLEHCWGIPHKHLVGKKVKIDSNNSISKEITSEKGFQDYLNYYLHTQYKNPTGTKMRRLDELSSDAQARVKKDMENLQSAVFNIKNSIAAPFIPGPDTTYESYLKGQLATLQEFYKKVIAFSNIGNGSYRYIYELNTLIFGLLSSIKSNSNRILEQLAKEKFKVDVKAGMVRDVTVKDNFKNEFCDQILLIYTDTISGRNINNKEHITEVFKSISDFNSFKEFMIKYKTVIAPTLFFAEYEFLLEKYYPLIRLHIIEKMANKVDDSYWKNVDDSKDIISIINNSVTKDKDFNKKMTISNMVIKEQANNLDNNGNYGDAFFDLAIYLDSLSEKEINYDVCFSVLSYYYYMLLPHKNNPDVDEVYSSLIEEFLEEHKDIYLKGLQLFKDFDVLASGNNNNLFKDKAPLKQLFNSTNGNLPPILEDTSSSDYALQNETLQSEVTQALDNLRNAKIDSYILERLSDIKNKYSNATYDAKNDIKISIDELSSEIIDKYGVPVLFKKVITNNQVVDLLKYEYYTGNMCAYRNKAMKPSLIIGPNQGVSEYEYLRDAWDSVSFLHNFEFNFDESPNNKITFKDMVKLIAEYQISRTVKNDGRSQEDINKDKLAIYAEEERYLKLFLSQHVSDVLVGKLPIKDDTQFSYIEAREIFKNLKMNIFDSKRSYSDQERFSTYTRTFIYDKMHYKSKTIANINNGVFTIANVRKAVEAVLSNFRFNGSEVEYDVIRNNYSDEQTGLILELPSKYSSSILLYIQWDKETQTFKPAHILNDIKLNTDKMDVYVTQPGSSTMSMAKLTIKGNDLGNPDDFIAAYTKASITRGTNHRTINLHGLVNNSMMSKQDSPEVESEIILTSSNSKRLVRSFTKRNQELDEIIREYPIILQELLDNGYIDSKGVYSL